MTFVNVPRDLSDVESKALLGLTRKQLIGFTIAGLLGAIVYFTTRTAIGNTFALLLLMVVAIPPIMYGIYKPVGKTVPEYVYCFLHFTFVSKKIRPYKSENIYLWLQEKIANEEVDSIVKQKKHRYNKAGEAKRRKQKSNTKTRSRSQAVKTGK